MGLASTRSLSRVWLLAKHRTGLDPDKFSYAFLKAECNAVIDYWGLESWEDYEKVSRAGRGAALPVRQRRQLWEAFSQVRDELKHNKLRSWGDMCGGVTAADFSRVSPCCGEQRSPRRLCTSLQGS